MKNTLAGIIILGNLRLSYVQILWTEALRKFLIQFFNNISRNIFILFYGSRSIWNHSTLLKSNGSNLIRYNDDIESIFNLLKFHDSNLMRYTVIELIYDVAIKKKNYAKKERYLKIDMYSLRSYEIQCIFRETHFGKINK